MKVGKLLSGFLAAIITVLFVVSLADGGDPNGDNEAPFKSDPPNGATVTTEELKEKGITLWFPKPIKTGKIINVVADGCCSLLGWTFNICEGGMAAKICAGELSYDTGFVLECVDKSGNTYEAIGEALWETELALEWSVEDVSGNYYVLTRTSHSGSESKPSKPTESETDYRNEFECIPEEDPYRPPRNTPKASITYTFDRPITSCTATVTYFTGKSFSIPVEQMDENTVELSIPQANTKVELYLTDEAGNKGYCATTIMAANAKPNADPNDQDE